MSDMREMKMRRTDLTDVLKKNRAEHRTIFEAAVEGFVEQAQKQLADLAAKALGGWGHIQLAVRLPIPQDYTGEYDEAIKMLEMCIDNEIVITSDDFDRLVMDNWGWKKSFSETVSNYTQQ